MLKDFLEDKITKEQMAEYKKAGPQPIGAGGAFDGQATATDVGTSVADANGLNAKPSEELLRRRLNNFRTFLCIVESDEVVAEKAGQEVPRLKAAIKEVEDEIQNALPPKVRTEQCDAEIWAADKAIDKAKRSDEYDGNMISWYQNNKIQNQKSREEALKKKEAAEHTKRDILVLHGEAITKPKRVLFRRS